MENQKWPTNESHVRIFSDVSNLNLNCFIKLNKTMNKNNINNNNNKQR